MNRSLPLLVTTAFAVLPVTNAMAASHPLSVLHSVTAQSSAVSVRSVKGPSVTMQWGAVQVTIVVQSKRIRGISVTTPHDRPRSVYINKQAVPLLVQEVLQAQSANIDLISGATLTSEAFDQSLQAAITNARKAHIL